MSTSTPDFAQLFDFDDSDLKANQAGYLSYMQQWRMRRRLVSASQMQMFWLLMGVLLIGGIILLLTGAAGYVVLIAFVLYLAAMGAVLVSIYFSNGQLRQAIEAGKVKHIQGVAQISAVADTSGRTQQHQMQIDDVTFHLTEQTRRVFQNGQRYTIYYLPGSQTIVAAETHNAA